FSSRRRHTRWPRDWSSDVCSSDLLLAFSGGAVVWGMVALLGCVTLCRCEPAIPDQGSRLIPFGARISSRTGSSRLRRGPLTCEAHDGAVLRCGNPVLVPLDPLPLRHHVDRSALLLQLRTGSVHGRGGRGDQERRDAEARAARAVV